MPISLAEYLVTATAAVRYLRLLGRDALTTSERSAFRWLVDQFSVADGPRRPINPELEAEVRDCSDEQADVLFNMLEEIQEYTDPNALESASRPDPAGREGIAHVTELFGIKLNFGPRDTRREVMQKLDLLARLLKTVRQLEAELASVKRACDPAWFKTASAAASATVSKRRRQAAAEAAVSAAA